MVGAPEVDRRTALRQRRAGRAPLVPDRRGLALLLVEAPPGVGVERPLVGAGGAEGDRAELLAEPRLAGGEVTVRVARRVAHLRGDLGRRRRVALDLAGELVARVVAVVVRVGL